MQGCTKKSVKYPAYFSLLRALIRGLSEGKSGLNKRRLISLESNIASLNTRDLLR